MPLADAAKLPQRERLDRGHQFSTRALTALNSRHGGFRLTPVGRVQTPTLTILVKREQRDRRTSCPAPIIEVHADSSA